MSVKYCENCGGQLAAGENIHLNKSCIQYLALSQNSFFKQTQEALAVLRDAVNSPQQTVVTDQAGQEMVVDSTRFIDREEHEKILLQAKRDAYNRGSEDTRRRFVRALKEGMGDDSLEDKRS